MIGFDFFLHGGLLSSIYSRPSPFLLPPERAFALIPVGYASFLVLAIFLFWLIRKLNIEGLSEGFIFGLKVGTFTWGALGLGLYSIATAPPILLISWTVGQAIELGIAGLVIGYGLAQANLKRLTMRVLTFVVFCFIAGVLIQNIVQ